MSRFQSYAIVPAAGRSQRMGAAKLLLQYQSQPLIDHVLRCWLAVVDHVVVVVRSDDDELAERCGRHPVDVVQPATAPADMKESVQLGLQHIADRYLPQPHDCWLLAPADMPRMRPQDAKKVLSQYDPDAPRILVASHQGKRGHPLLAPWASHVRVFDLAADEGVRDFLDKQEHDLVACDNAAVLEDVDTPEDYRRLSE